MNIPEKFKDKYRIPSNRLRGWDYARNGHYYITIVTADRKRLFGEIVNGEMVLNDWGQIVNDEFFKSFEMRAELFLGEFILMPDHLHAIVILDKSKCMDIGACGDGSHGDVSFGNVVNYYDHIIRDEMEYRHIAEYIVRNPIVHDDAKKRER